MSEVKITESILRTDNAVTVPDAVQNLLKWKHGDKFDVLINQETGSLIYRKKK